MFMFKAKTIIDEIEKYQPEYYKYMQRCIIE